MTGGGALHDATVRAIEVDWPGHSLRVHLVGPGGPVTTAARGLPLLHAPRHEPWGPSTSVLAAVGPDQRPDGVTRLLLQVQSGDELLIEAEEIVLSSS